MQTVRQAAQPHGVRQCLIIILTLPLSIIGITAGLLLTNKGFGFLAMLGMLSLIGMMIRNKVILIGEIDQWIAKGTDRYQAVGAKSGSSACFSLGFL